MKNTSSWAERAFSRLLVMVMALAIGFGQVAPSFAQAVDPVARGLAAKANTAAGIVAAGGALVDNKTAPRFAHWRTALARVQLGAGNATLLVVGTSISAGEGSTGSGPNGNPISKSIPTLLAGRLTALGLPASWQAINADHANATASAITAFDSRVVPGPWVGNFGTLGGSFLYSNAVSSTPLAITPTTSFDTIDIWYFRNPGNGTFTVNVDGGATLSTINSSGTAGFVKATITCTAGTHTINLTQTGAGPVYVMTVIPRTAANKEVTVINAARRGGLAAHYGNDNNIYGSRAGLKAIAPDLTLIELTANDWKAPTDLTLYSNYIQNIIDDAKLSGDVLLYTSIPSDTSYASIAQQQQYIDAIVALGVKNNVTVLNTTDRWTSFAFSNALGMYFDGLHPAGIGSADLANGLARVLGP